MTIKDSLKLSTEKLKKSSPSPYLDAEILLAFTIKKSREFVLAHPEIELTKGQESKFMAIIEKRSKNEPVAYITGNKEFYGLDFKVTRNTLIPRPETENLVEWALSDVADILNKAPEEPLSVVDVGAGSGNIIISTAHTLAPMIRKGSRIKFFGIDISASALRVARSNSNKLKPAEKIIFFKGDLLEPMIKNPKSEIRNSKLIILANLPYLSKKIHNDSPDDVKNFEPRSALVSDGQGLGHYGKLFRQIKKIHKNIPNIRVFIEFSAEQKTLLEKIIKAHFPSGRTRFRKDLAGRWRLARITP